MKDFIKVYKRQLKDYPSSCKEAAEVFADLLLNIFVLSLPVTLFVVYPVVVLWRRIKS
ncbi:hypothetical protein UFOVP555_52 [uncultured Caudovirales phage]|uniref:Uncharacterized protein n=1 Tax=uncultured Caudovirales phage TaxID=2100421 RepID=A0A6J5MY85_9CAUD|nr:hypothetical protein UFOVP555_52 [uncultured Caudovirales phage]